MNAWPADRSCPFEGMPTLKACWNRSAGLISSLRNEFEETGVTDQVRTVFVSGSIGRMEAVGSSDCDLVVVLSEADRASGSLIMPTVFDCVERVGCQRPKAAGIFGFPTSFEELLNPETAGVVDEDLGVFGKRIQALLDSQPLLHAAEFESLQLKILKRYACAPVADPDAFELGWLVDDLIRYWRSLCARTRWLSHENQAQWRALNIKVRHSRMLLCAGLYHLLVEVMDSDDPVPDLHALLRLVPLERVNRQTESRRDVLQGYETFMDAMSRGLIEGVGDDDVFARLIANGAALSQRLGERFVQRFGNLAATGLFGEMR